MIDSENKKDISWFIENDKKKQVKPNEIWNKIIQMENIISIILVSSNYNMLNKADIICYYELEDAYNNTILEEILNQIK